MCTFGGSAPIGDLMAKFGCTSNGMLSAAHKQI